MILSLSFNLRVVLTIKEKVDMPNFRNLCFRQVFWMQKLRSQTIQDSRYLSNALGIELMEKGHTKYLILPVMFTKFQPLILDALSELKQNH